MKVAKLQFEHELQTPSDRNSNIILIGMSGSGKTHWSKLLSEKHGFNLVEFDNLIGDSAELADLIKDIPGRDPAEKMGNYFGMPWTEGYKAKETTFLSIERRFMAATYPNGSVLDLTGSCIYHPDQMWAISRTGLVIYLETSPEKQRDIFETFKKNPKPIIWGGLFKRNDGETNEKALERCYPLLLNHRSGLYASAADVVLPYDVHKNARNVGELVQEVTKQL